MPVDPRYEHLIIFDLDGTLALGKHREHFLTEKTPKDWDSYFKACGDDEPNWPIVETFYVYNNYYVNEMEIWSGRIEALKDGTDIRAMTIEWLRRYVLWGPNLTLRMRPAGDYREDSELKESWLHECEVKPFLVFDDRQRVVDMWRRNGITCCQVAPGDF